MKPKESEKTLEARLVREIEARGGMALKYTSQFHRGIPDRIILMPMGRIAFVEVKAPGESPRKLQLARHRFLRLLGFKTFVLDNPEQIGGILDEIRTA